MTALSSGLHFLSGIALYLGAQPDLRSRIPSARQVKRRRKDSDAGYRPLTDRQKKELLDSIREDDWHE